MEGFKGSDLVSEHYDANTAFADVLNAIVPGFEYPDWSYLTISQLFKRLSVSDRGRVEDALNGWSLSDKKLTTRQEQFVSEHSGELRSDEIRASIARIGTEAMALMRTGDEARARTLMLKSGMSDATTDLLLLGWKHENIEHSLDEQPAVCCVVNAVGHKTYVGRIVQMTNRAVYQEIEPGQIVEHALGAFGDRLKDLEASFLRSADMESETGELVNPWGDSWCIAYSGGGKATLKKASLMLLDGLSVKPNAFEGRVVSETNARFVQENENNVYAGHLKSMTGELEIGEHYSIRYHGTMGNQVAEVNGVVQKITLQNALQRLEKAGTLGQVQTLCAVVDDGFVADVCTVQFSEADWTIWNEAMQSKMNSFGIENRQERKIQGEVGKHDWCIGKGCEDGYPVFVDDRQLSYRATPELAEKYAREVIADLQADGDYRLSDRPSGFLPPKRTAVSVGDALSIGVGLFKKLNVVVTPHDIAACLAGQRGNASYSGRILDVDEERGLVVQSCGRQSATVHRLGDFAEVPKVKDMMDVKYQGGVMGVVVKEVEPSRGVGR